MFNQKIIHVIYFKFTITCLLAWNSSLHEMFIQLVDAAKTPSSATPGIELEVSVDQDDIKHIIMTGAAITVVGLVSIWY